MPTGTFEQTPEVQSMSAEGIDVRSAMEMAGFEDQDGVRWYDRHAEIAVQTPGEPVIPVTWSEPVFVVMRDGSRNWTSLRNFYDWYMAEFE